MFILTVVYLSILHSESSCKIVSGLAINIMLLRGPYKQYEVNTSVAVPKSTFYRRCKRCIAELNDDQDDIFHEHGHAVGNQPQCDGEAYLC